MYIHVYHARDVLFGFGIEGKTANPEEGREEKHTQTGNTQNFRNRFYSWLKKGRFINEQKDSTKINSSGVFDLHGR